MGRGHIFQTLTLSLLCESRDVDALYTFIQKNTAPSTIVYTSLWADLRKRASENESETGRENTRRQYVNHQYASRMKEANDYRDYVYRKLSSVRPTEQPLVHQYLDEVMWRDRYGRNEKLERDENVALRSIISHITKRFCV